MEFLTFVFSSFQVRFAELSNRYPDFWGSDNTYFNSPYDEQPCGKEIEIHPNGELHFYLRGPRGGTWTGWPGY